MNEPVLFSFDVVAEAIKQLQKAKFAPTYYWYYNRRKKRWLFVDLTKKKKK